LSPTSNVRIARDREWFVEYHPYRTHASHGNFGYLKAVGIGVVETPVEKSPPGSGPENHAKLRLHHVLRVQTALYNILGAAFYLGLDHCGAHDLLSIPQGLCRSQECIS
jgi:hypothetical protein